MYFGVFDLSLIGSTTSAVYSKPKLSVSCEYDSFDYAT